MQRYGKDQAQRVLALLGTHARVDLIVGAHHRDTAYSHAAVERILSSRGPAQVDLGDAGCGGMEADPALVG